MLFLTYARQRIHAVLEEIAKLKDSDFPYSHSRDALEQFETLFNTRSTALEDLIEENDPEFVKTACSESLLQVLRYLPLLGFVLRSTNVRNSFEIFGPLLRLARQILGPDTKLILSSEWDFFPYVYNSVPDLPSYVLLGLPASESGNPLLVPLAGHELGHTTWQRQEIANEFEPLISQSIEEQVRTQENKYNDLFGVNLSNWLFVSQNLAPAHYWAMRQTEESFCDFLGVRLFAESYLFAFAYVMVPGGSARSVLYPSLRDRVANLVKASTELGIKPPDDFSSWFSDETSPVSSDKERFLLSLADTARKSLVGKLIEKANKIAESSRVPTRSDEKINTILQSFELLTPASCVGDLTNILNAAWRAFHKQDMWKGIVENRNRIETLNELVLKSIDILEFEERMKEPG